MASKLVIPNVSYGIGVQNRYSAFLDDDDGLILNVRNITLKQTNGPLAGATRGQLKTSNGQAAAKGQSKTSGQKSASTKGPIGASNGQQSEQKQQQQQPNGQQQQARPDAKRSRNPAQPGHGGQQNQSPRQQFGHAKQGPGYNRDQRAGKPHQSYQGQQLANGGGPINKENSVQSGERYARNKNTNYQYRRSNGTNDHHADLGDERKGNLAFNDGQTINPLAASEDVKRRRQQKRAIDLKYKNPEKAEARRPQANGSNQDQPQEEATDTANRGASGGPVRFQPGGFRGRRRFDDNPRSEGERGQGHRGNRVRRDDQQQQPAGETNGVADDSQQQAMRPAGPRTDRQPRNRNGFGFGSRGSRGSRGEEYGKNERAKPIPNFSNKLDFPSLVS